MKSSAPASVAAWSTRSKEAPGSAKAMLAVTVSVNRNVSSKTTATALRRSRSQQVADVDPVEGDPAGVDVVEAGDQAGQRRLARAGRPDDRHRLAGGDGEIEAVEDGVGVRGVGEPHPLEADLAGPGRQSLRTGPVGDHGGGVEDLANPFRRGHGPLRLGDDLADRAQRVDQHRDVEVELDQLPHLDAVVHHQEARRRRARRPWTATGSRRAAAGSERGSWPGARSGRRRCPPGAPAGDAAPARRRSP